MKRLICGLLLAMPLAVQATGYYHVPRVIVQKVVVTNTVTNTQTVYVAKASSTAWIGYTAMGLVAVYFGAAIATHEQCIREEDARKVPDKDRKCYRHVPQPH